jgi:hypothetical protein
MPLLLLVILGALAIAIGFWCRRNDRNALSVASAIKVVPIAFGLTLAVAGGVVPSVYTALALGWAKFNGRAVDDIRPYLLPGTNADEFVQATVIATVLLAIIALIEYVRMCKGRR